MRKLIYLFIVGGALLSCQNNNKYTITGTVPGDAYEGTEVYLQEMSEDAMVSTDTAIVEKGLFSFSGTADNSVLRFIALDKTVNQQQESIIPVLVEPGKLQVTFDTVISVKGTQANEAYTNFRLKEKELMQSVRDIFEKYNNAHTAGILTESMDAELKKSFEGISDQITNLNFNFVKENITNKIGEFVFQNSYSMFEPEKQKEILDLAGEEFKSNENIQSIIKRLENAEKVKVGNKFLDFTLKDPEGREVSLSDYAGKGNYVLVDFWAAWCGPCRQEMPNVVEAYKKYKSKGFEVVGISLDQQHDSWIKGLEELNMTWPQMSDLQQWKSQVVDLYAIDGIPHTVLLDKDGTILEKDLRGEALEAKLAELMP